MSVMNTKRKKKRRKSSMFSANPAPNARKRRKSSMFSANQPPNARKRRKRKSSMFASNQPPNKKQRANNKHTLQNEEENLKREMKICERIMNLLKEIQPTPSWLLYKNELSKFAVKQKMGAIEKLIGKLKTSQVISTRCIKFYESERDVIQLLAPFAQFAKCLQYLIALNCDIDYVNLDGQNSAHIACEYSNIVALQIFAAHNLNMTLQNKDRLTPLHIAFGKLMGTTFPLQKEADVAILCTKYALLNGQNMYESITVSTRTNTNDIKYCNESILDIAMTNKYALYVLYKGYKLCMQLSQEIKDILLTFDSRINDVIPIIWAFTYYPLPDQLNEALKEAKRKQIKPKLKLPQWQY